MIELRKLHLDKKRIVIDRNPPKKQYGLWTIGDPKREIRDKSVFGKRT